jgi:hypothetical protein
MTKRLVYAKYYMLDGDTAIRLLSRSAWEKWVAATPPEKLVLARNVVRGVVVETRFKGVEYDGAGAYETTVSSASSGHTEIVKRYPGLSSGQALTGHLGLVHAMTEGV